MAKPLTWPLTLAIHLPPISRSAGLGRIGCLVGKVDASGSGGGGGGGGGSSNQQCRRFGIRSIGRPTATRYNSGKNLPSLLSSPKQALRRRLEADTLPLRTGALAVKKGMTSMFAAETGERIPCTVLQMERVQVVAHKVRRKHGYDAVCIGHGWRRAKNLTKPMLGHYSSQGVAPKAELREFRVRDRRGLLPVGTEIQADWFIDGQFVDARSNCKGKGFQGVMKRWGMHGQDRSHGASLSHRSLGSAGQSQGGGSRVYPGKKMAGRMGGQRNTVQNLKVLQVDAAKGIVVLHGAVSGPKGCTVMIQDALKKPWPDVKKTRGPAASESETPLTHKAATV